MALSPKTQIICVACGCLNRLESPMNRPFLYALPGILCAGALVSFATLSSFSWKGFNLAPAPARAQLENLEIMTLERLETILQTAAADLEGGEGQWQVTVEGRSLVVLADSTNDRMRIVSPVAPAGALSTQEVQAMLVANFHSALDARYAVTNGTVVSVFVHPLSSLQEADLRSGLFQVATLATNFGTSYSSGGLGFGAIGGEPQPGNAAGGDFEI